MKKLFALLTFVTVFAACTSTSNTEPTVTTDSLTTETVDTAAGTALSVIVDSTATDTVAVK
jgi:hypothetical protein